MGKPILYYAELSPPCRAVLLTAAEIGLELELKVVNWMNGDQLTPEFVKLNPQHTIPLLDDNGTIIVDSHVICGYIVDKYGKNESLYPKDIVQRANVDARLHFDTGFLFARLHFLFEPILFTASPIVPTEKTEFIEKCYPILEAFLEKSDYLCGNNLTIADFCCIATVSSIDDIVVIDAQKYPKLLKWIARLAALPYYEKNNANGAKRIQNVYLQKVKENKAAAAK